MMGGVIVTVVLIFFVIGESLPTPISPTSVALLGVTLALLLAYQSRIDSVNNFLKDVDWSTLIFFMSIFVLIGGLHKTGVIKRLSGVLTGLKQKLRVKRSIMGFWCSFHLKRT